MEFYGSIHNHTDFSNFRLRDSINTTADLINYAVELNHNFIAITEHETISNSILAEDIEKKIRVEHPDFKVIRGNEIYLCRNGLCADNYDSKKDGYYHFILLAKDAIGHQQIREISTRAWRRSYVARGMRRVPTYYNDLIEIIGSNPGHVIFSTACLGSFLGQQLLRFQKSGDITDFQRAKNWIRDISSICGSKNFFLETQPSLNNEQQYVNEKIKELSQEFNIPVVISLDAHYLKKEDADIHEAFLNSAHGDREVKSFYASTYLMSREEIHEYMDESVGVETVSLWMNNTKLIYDMCEYYSLKKPLNIPYLPRQVDVITKEEYQLFENKIEFLKEFYTSPHKADRDMAAAIIKKILKNPDEFNNQKTFEEIGKNLDAMWISSEKLNTRWSAYLLNMRDYINVIWTKGNSLVGCSRGCFYPNEKVLLYNGTEKNISNIKIGDRVVNHNGQINTVKDIYNYEIEEQCYVIKGRGREPVHCTDNHKFYVKKCSSCDNSSYKNHWCKETCRRAKKCIYEKDHEVGFVPAKDLRIGDLIAYPKPKLQPLNKKYVDLANYIKDDTYVFIEDKVVGYYMGNNRKRKGVEVPRFLPIDEELAYVCGVFIGDGWTRSDEKRQHEIGFAFHSENEKDLNSLKRCEDFFLSLGLKTSKVKHPNKKLIQLHVFSKVLHHFFRKNFGENTYSKHICDWLISSDKKITKALLLGLMASDGHYGKNNICYDSVNKQLIKQVQMLWASIGIYGHYKERIPTNKNWINSYKWSASGKQLNKLIEDFPLINITSKKWTRQEYLEDEDCFYTPIESINIEQYKGKVYDLNVENIHSYVINGTSVHNSGGGFLLLYMLDITQVNPLREKSPQFYWRFLNPERASVLDIDTDIEGSKRERVYKALQEEYGENRVTKVLTLRTEKSKSALLTAARGLGYDIEIGQHLAALVQSDRGATRTLKQTYYGDIENDMQPNSTFKDLVDNKYSDLWEVAQKIEGLISGVGSHAGGIIFTDQDFSESTALMRTNNGDLVTQFELHTAEEVGLIKIDLLSVEALDKIRACLELLVEQGYIEGNKPLKQIYEDTVGIYNLVRDDKEMWEKVHNQEITSLFQMEKDSGVKGIALSKPTSVDELAILNSIIRLMAQEKGGEMPLETYARYKKNLELWYQEMERWGLSDEEQDLLKERFSSTYGICCTQEQFMSLVQLPECGGMSLLWSDLLRKAIAKKHPEEFEKLEKEYFEVVEQKGLSKNFCNYVWKVLVSASKGYGFNLSHTLAYSLIGLQEMNLAYRFPIIFWNTANLIVDSGSMDIKENFDVNADTSEIESSSVDYGKISVAIGRMKEKGIEVSSPNINKSSITFSPDVENNIILYGLKGITRINNKFIATIIKNRPYVSIQDFLTKTKANKLQMINLIKSGAFDCLVPDRVAAMDEYIDLIADKKNRITMQNIMALIKYNFLPQELEFEKNLFNFNKELKKNKVGNCYKLNTKCFTFYSKYFDLDLIETEDGYTGTIKQAVWDKIYKDKIKPLQVYVKTNADELLIKLNNQLLEEVTEKYTKGTISKWEMDSLGFYKDKHELSNINKEEYEIDDYFKLSREPEEDGGFFNKEGKYVQLFKITRICGTVIYKDKAHNTISLLTTNGVVNVKIFKELFAYYDRQISQKDTTGKKHILEKSWLSRGNKLLISGIRRDDTFIPKKYKRSKFQNVIERIDEIDENGLIITTKRRLEVEE